MIVLFYGAERFKRNDNSTQMHMLTVSIQ